MSEKEKILEILLFPKEGNERQAPGVGSHFHMVFTVQDSIYIVPCPAPITWQWEIHTKCGVLTHLGSDSDLCPSPLGLLSGRSLALSFLLES